MMHYFHSPYTTASQAFSTRPPPQGVALKKVELVDGVPQVLTIQGPRKATTLKDYIAEQRRTNTHIAEPIIWKATHQFIMATDWLSFEGLRSKHSVWIDMKALYMVDDLPWLDSYEPISSYDEFSSRIESHLLDPIPYQHTFSDTDFSWSLGIFMACLSTLKDTDFLINELKQFVQSHAFIIGDLVCNTIHSNYLRGFISLCLTCTPSKRPRLGFLGLLAFSTERSLEINNTYLDIDDDSESCALITPSITLLTSPLLNVYLNMHLDNMAACIFQHRNNEFEQYIPWLTDYSVANDAMFLAYKSRNIVLGARILKYMTAANHPPPVFPIHVEDVYTATNLISELLKLSQGLIPPELMGNYIEEHIEEVGVKCLNFMALDIAAMYGTTECVEKLLIEIGFYKDTRITSLMAAASAGRIDNAKLLMIQARIQEGSGMTALMLAAKKGFIDIVRLLKNKECKLMSNACQTSLMMAAHENNIAIVEELAPLESTMSTDNGTTALMDAAQEGHEGVVQALLKYEVRMQNKNKQTALMLAVVSGKLKEISLLFEEAQMQDAKGCTALIYAAENGNSEYTTKLFPLEAQLVDCNRWTATMHAVRKCQDDSLKELVTCSTSKHSDKSELNMCDNHGNTALIIAILLNNYNATDLLLPHEWKSRTITGESVFEVAVKARNMPILQCVYRFYQANGLLDDIPLERVLLTSLKYRSLSFTSSILGMVTMGRQLESQLLTIILEHGLMPDSNSSLYMHFSSKAKSNCKELLKCLDALDSTESFQTGLEQLQAYTPENKRTILFAVLSANMAVTFDNLLQYTFNSFTNIPLQDITDHSGRSLLMAAIEIDDNICLSKLLKYLTKPLSADQGSMLLNHAITYLSHNSMQVICDYLLENNIQASVAAREGFLVSNKTLLIKAITKRDTAKILALRTNDISQNHPYNDFNLLWNSGTGCRSPLMTANANLVISDTYRHLLCNMGIRSTDNFTALQDSCLLASWDIVKYFTFEREISGMTWMMIYAAVGNYEQVKMHIHEAGIRAGFNYTGLIYASRNGHADCVSLLAEKEAGMTTTTGRTALFWALIGGYSDCADILYEKEYMICDNQGQTPLMAAAVGGVASYVSRFLDAGLYGDVVDAKGETALMKAAEANHPECVRILLEKTNELRKTTSKGVTALMFAAITNSLECIKSLIPAEAGLRDIRGSTALMYAASNGKLEAVQLLMDYEGGLLDNSGISALFLASLEGHLDCVKALYTREYPVLVRGSFNITHELSLHLSELASMLARGQPIYEDVDDVSELIPNVSTCLEYLLSRQE